MIFIQMTSSTIWVPGMCDPNQQLKLGAFVGLETVQTRTTTMIRRPERQKVLQHQVRGRRNFTATPSKVWEELPNWVCREQSLQVRNRSRRRVSSIWDVRSTLAEISWMTTILEIHSGFTLIKRNHKLSIKRKTLL